MIKQNFSYETGEGRNDGRYIELSPKDLIEAFKVERQERKE